MKVKEISANYPVCGFCNIYQLCMILHGFQFSTYLQATDLRKLIQLEVETSSGMTYICLR